MRWQSSYAFPALTHRNNRTAVHTTNLLVFHAVMVLSNIYFSFSLYNKLLRQNNVQNITYNRAVRIEYLNFVLNEKYHDDGQNKIIKETIGEVVDRRQLSLLYLIWSIEDKSNLFNVSH